MIADYAPDPEVPVRIIKASAAFRKVGRQRERESPNSSFQTVSSGLFRVPHLHSRVWSRDQCLTKTRFALVGCQAR